MIRRCTGTTTDGSPCGAAPLTGGTSCRFHDPACAADVAEGRRLGGLRRRRETILLNAHDLEGFRSRDQIARALEAALIDTFELPNSWQRNRTVALLAQTALKADERELQERVAALEAATRHQRHPPRVQP